MEKRLTLDQFKKNVGTQDLELQKLSVKGLGNCHPQNPSTGAQNTLEGALNEIWDRIRR
ncbi:hypothetical protein [Chryseobacterium rhizosphaerae]|uniref:hypothetical protein n=1 Tax=Chryseobacterium rhizosphaerae TaxID=395937 RepID=UPI0023599180|nr:hypothetical protein [Chryseobacterium rhizosphaerae]MDC8098617.1 hypothetical protein [Chryseobacterium rhizosphaerae]